MNKNLKGGIFIGIGVISYFLLPHLFGFIFIRLFHIFNEFIYLITYYGRFIISLVFIVLGIVTFIKQSSSSDEPYDVIEDNSIQGKSNIDHNKVIRITLLGGLIGLFAGSPLNRLSYVIDKENSKGYRVVQVFNDASGNFLINLLRLIILVITLFIYTPSNGYYITLEKNNKK